MFKQPGGWGGGAPGKTQKKNETLKKQGPPFLKVKTVLKGKNWAPSRLFFFLSIPLPCPTPAQKFQPPFAEKKSLFRSQNKKIPSGRLEKMEETLGGPPPPPLFFCPPPPGLPPPPPFPALTTIIFVPPPPPGLNWTF